MSELAELGCRFQQGYFHGHPAALAGVLDSLDSIPFRALDGSDETDDVDDDTDDGPETDPAATTSDLPVDPDERSDAPASASA